MAPSNSIANFVGGVRAQLLGTGGIGSIFNKKITHTAAFTLPNHRHLYKCLVGIP